MSIRGHYTVWNARVCDIKDLIEHSQQYPIEEVETDYLFNIVRMNDTRQIWGLFRLGQMVEHIKLVNNAILYYPVLMYQEKVLDGNHRILKAKINDVKRMKVIKMQSLPIPSGDF